MGDEDQVIPSSQSADSNHQEKKSEQISYINKVETVSRLEMKINDLSSNLCDPSDITNLPFSMPKLERRIQESRNLSVKHPMNKPINTLMLSLPTESENGPKNPENINHPELCSKFAKHLRPSSFAETSSDSAQGQSKSPALQLKLPLPRPGQTRPGGLQLNIISGGRVASPAAPQKRKPLLFLTPTLNLSQSVDVDTSIPLVRQVWYHGVLSRVEAERILKAHSEGSYLVRTTLDQTKTEYSLAIKSSRGFMHLRIRKEEEEENISFRLGEFDKKFSSVVDMVRHYSINRLPIRGAEHMCLLTPVTEELL